jgi:hypothetical protein
VAKAKALKLAAGGGFAGQALLSPSDSIKMTRLPQKLLGALSVFPPVVESHTSSIAQQVTVPVLAATHATIASLDGANAPFHVIVGAGKILPIVALNEMPALVGCFSAPITLAAGTRS